MINADLKQAQSSFGQTRQSYFSRLEEWLNCQNYTEILLVTTNLFLMLKTSTNLLAILFDSRNFLVDYAGYFLLSNGNNEPEFVKWCFIFTNLAVILTSFLCIILCFVKRTSELRTRILRLFIQCQLTLAIIVMIFMGKLWFAPLKLKLDEYEWKQNIIDYNYQFLPDSNGLLPNAGSDFDGYSSRIDRIQQALGCCGFSGPNDWKQLNAAALLAPSCCKNPVALEVETLVVGSLENSTSRQSIKIASNGQPSRKQTSILQRLTKFSRWPWTDTSPNEVQNQARGPTETFFHCQTNSWELERWPMSDLQEFGLGPAGAVEPLGCQRLLTNRGVLFAFNLRLSLLLLFATQVLMILAALSLYSPMRKSTNQHQQRGLTTSEWFNFGAFPSQIKPTQLSDWLQGHSNQSYVDDSSFSTEPSSRGKMRK